MRDLCTVGERNDEESRKIKRGLAVELDETQEGKKKTRKEPRLGYKNVEGDGKRVSFALLLFLF
jgi:hypothetical protein